MTQSTKPRTRTVLVVDNSHVARRVGDRIRHARTRASLTQAQVAHGRYTAAYISALERGLAKPSMAALTFLSDRLGVAVTDLVAEDRPALGRLEADLLLSSGKWQEALDRYDTLLETAGEDRRQRAEVERGRAEALCRLGRARDAIRPAAEAAELFDGLGSPADAAAARYWLAVAHYQEDNAAEARRILHDLLAGERGGLKVAPDFIVQVLALLGNLEASDGQSDRALAHMEEARALLPQVSLDERAAYLSRLAAQHRRAGDLERSIRVGHESLGLFRAAAARLEEGRLDVSIAIAHLQVGDPERAAEPLARARVLADRHQAAVLLCEVAEAEARLAFARGDEATARERAEDALAAAEDGASFLIAVGAHLTLARLARRSDDREETEARFDRAASLLREHRFGSQLRDVLAEWADVRSGWGDPQGANALYAEALGRIARSGSAEPPASDARARRRTPSRS